MSNFEVKIYILNLHKPVQNRIKNRISGNLNWTWYNAPLKSPPCIELFTFKILYAWPGQNILLFWQMFQNSRVFRLEPYSVRSGNIV